MWVPVCAVQIVNNDCPVGWTVQFIAQASLTVTDIRQLLISGIIPMCMAFAFRAIRLSIHD
ncbi:hypothetical protein [Photobacterium leiognathi]|uniref:hypothetical protein n=1 Tax=Photobacterium leiognathi TaxID=553611 RepID=UPI0027391F4B|nr:hypothetical protein [Photobacterium leiognathi]